MYRKRHKGPVAPLAIALTILVASVVGVTAYNAVQHGANNHPAKATPSPDTKSASKYLHIKELGIKIQLAGDINDLTYGYDGQRMAQYPDPQVVGLASESITRLSSTCDTKHGPLGLIGKTKNSNQGFGTLEVNNVTVFSVGGYFIYYQAPQAACLDSTTYRALVTKQKAALLQSLKTVQPDSE